MKKDNPIFSKKIDLRLKENRKSVVHVLERNPDFCNLTISEVEASLEFIIANLPSGEWLMMYPWLPQSLGLFEIRKGKKTTGTITLLELVNLGFRLSKLANCKGFNKLLEGFSNPTQFHDTIFETDTAYYCLSCAKIKKIEFSPLRSVRGKPKNPDFELHTETGELVCECKNLHPQESDYLIRFEKIFRSIETSMRTVCIPDDIRVSIHLTHAPRGSLTHWSNSIAQEVNGMIQNKTPKDKKLGSFSIHIGPRHQRSPRPKKPHLVAGVVTIKNRPTPLTNTSLEMTAGYFDSAIERIVGRTIRRANSQLPEHKDCAIFLKTSRLTCAETAVDLRISLKSYSHILAFGLWSNKIAFRGRLKDQAKINDIFGPLQFEEGDENN